MDARRTFRDSTGREWLVNITVQQIRRVRQLLDIDLMRAFEPAELERLAGDPVTLVDVLWVLCSAEAIERKVTDEQFGESLAGESIEQAVNAFVGALIDFFPPGRNAALKKLWEKMQAVDAAALNLVNAKIDSLDTEKIVAAMLPQMPSDSGEPSTSSPE